MTAYRDAYITDDELHRMELARHLLPPPGDEVAAQLIAALRQSRSLLAHATCFEFQFPQTVASASTVLFGTPDDRRKQSDSPERHSPSGIFTVEKRDNDSWAIVHRRMNYTRDGQWVPEPLPSNRTDDFLARARWKLPEALVEAVNLSRS